MPQASSQEDEQGACSEAAQTELYNQCEAQFAKLQMLQDEIFLSEQDAQDQSVNRLSVTEAELKLWQSMEPELLTTNPEVLLQAGEKEMTRLCAELEMVHSHCQAKKDKLVETLKREEQWLQEKKQVLIAATEHAENLKKDTENMEIKRLMHDIQKKILSLKNYQETLTEALLYVLDTHFPLPENRTGASKNKKNKQQALTEDHISLNLIIQMLVNQALEAPHDPYVTIDETFWKPYIEMLLRYNIAVRHPENNLKIRLEHFV